MVGSPLASIGCRADQPSAAVEDQNLKVRGGGAVGLIPFQQQRNVVAGPLGIDRDGLDQTAAEALRIGERVAVERPRNRRPGGLIAVAGFIAGRGDIGDAFGLDGLNRLRDDAVLKERLVEIAHVVDDDFAAGRGQARGCRWQSPARC